MEKYQQKIIQTSRLKIAYYRLGEGNQKKLLMIHGNVSSSVFFMPLAPYLENDYDIVIPDLRCFGNTETLPVHAARGYRDWCDDLYSLCEALGWKRFYMLGWSMGGDIAMQFVISYQLMVKKLILVAPGSPYGFGGTKDEKGTAYKPIGLGSGGGSANPTLVVSGKMPNKTVFWDMMKEYLFKPPFQLNRQWEKSFAKEASRMPLGPDYYPGDYTLCQKWPFVVSGQHGVLNTMSPKNGNLSRLLEVKHKPDVLWIRGDADQIVSDESMMEFGYLGKIGLVPGWPGEKRYPPQPMIRQTRYFLDQYAEQGGKYIEIVIPGGHLCILESPLHFISALKTFLSQ